MFLILLFFFFNDTATTEIYTLSLHDALPIWIEAAKPTHPSLIDTRHLVADLYNVVNVDRKSTRLNSSHGYISYAVFCLKKKKHEIPSTLMRNVTCTTLATAHSNLLLSPAQPT